MASSIKIIEKLNLDLSRIKDELRVLLIQKKEKADKRDVLNIRAKEQRKKNASIREKRDSLNKEVQELKQFRKESQLELATKREKASRIHDFLEQNRKKTKVNSPKKIQKNIDELEWRIQTTSLKPQDERSLIDQVRKLETQLFTNKKIQEKEQELENLLDDINDSKAESMIYHKRILELAEKSQEYHLMFCENIEKTKAIQLEADEKHNEYLTVTQRIDALHKQRIDLLSQIKTLKIQINQANEKRKIELENKLSRELEVTSVAKLEKGEKLTLDEFKILAEKGRL
jgi:uncharacterized coiled-coil DUF342 family protein